MLTIHFSINRKPNEAIYQKRQRETMSSDIQIKPGKEVIVAQSCPTLHDPTNYQAPLSMGFSMEWIAIPVSRGSS